MADLVIRRGEGELADLEEKEVEETEIVDRGLFLLGKALRLTKWKQLKSLFLEKSRSVG